MRKFKLIATIMSLTLAVGLLGFATFAAFEGDTQTVTGTITVVAPGEVVFNGVFSNQGDAQSGAGDSKIDTAGELGNFDFETGESAKIIYASFTYTAGLNDIYYNGAEVSGTFADGMAVAVTEGANSTALADGTTYVYTITITPGSAVKNAVSFSVEFEFSSTDTSGT